MIELKELIQRGILMSHLQQFNNQIQTEEQLRELLGHPSELASKKVISSIDQNCMDFIELSPFIVLSTSDHLGNCDVSPRGDPPGFVKVLNEKVLLIPERPGNKRFDSLRNILGNPHIGILFFIPGLEETLRINGKANIIKDIDLLEQMQANGRTPTLAVAVEVEEAFIHLPRHLNARSYGKLTLGQVQNTCHLRPEFFMNTLNCLERPLPHLRNDYRKVIISDYIKFHL